MSLGHAVFMNKDSAREIQTDLNRIRNKGAFCDVALTSFDGEDILAHKVILSAHSPVFDKILRRNADKFPVIFLRGLESKLIKLIVDFIYIGSVVVEESYLKTFLEAASEFKLKEVVAKRGSDNENAENSCEKVHALESNSNSNAKAKGNMSVRKNDILQKGREISPTANINEMK